MKHVEAFTAAATPKLKYLDTASYMRGHSHGTQVPKTGIVLHETISGDIPGWRDITDINKYLAAKGYGIHGMTDLEGHIAWAFGMGSAIFWHAGGANTETIGIENVSLVPLKAPTNTLRRKLWALRTKQVRAIARLCAAIHNTEPHDIPLRYWDGTPGEKGIASHWDISQYHPRESEGHYDCRPIHRGGYFPLLEVVYLARTYAKTGIHL
jgi:hypothetical protein